MEVSSKGENDLKEKERKKDFPFFLFLSLVFRKLVSVTALLRHGHATSLWKTLKIKLEYCAKVIMKPELFRLESVSLLSSLGRDQDLLHMLPWF